MVNLHQGELFTYTATPRSAAWEEIMRLMDISNDMQMDSVTGLREAFRALACGEDVVLDDNADPITDVQRDTVLAVIYDHLASDGATMPSGSCGELDLPAGTTCGEAVAHLKGGRDG